MPLAPDPQCTRYVNQVTGVRGNDGSKEAPWIDLSVAKEWLSQAANVCRCTAELYVSAGNYSSESFVVLSSLRIIGLDDASEDEKPVGKVFVAVNSHSFVNLVAGSLEISNFTFVQGASSPQPLEDPIFWNHKALNMTNVSFLSITRGASLIYSISTLPTNLVGLNISDCVVDIRVDHAEPAPERLGGMITILTSSVSIHSSSFERNTLLLSDTIYTSAAGGSCLYARSGVSTSITRSNFLFNVVKFELRSSNSTPSMAPFSNDTHSVPSSTSSESTFNPLFSYRVYGGAALILSDIVTIEHVWFSTNQIIANPSEATTFGGSLAVINAEDLLMSTGHIQSSTAHVGGGFYFNVPVRRAGGSTLRIEDRSYFGGNYCARLGCGLAIEASSKVKVYITDSTINANELTTVSNDASESVVGGVGAAFVTTSSEPLESSLVISRSEILLNSFSKMWEYQIGGGGALLTYGFLNITLEESSLGAGALLKASGAVWMRLFRTVSFYAMDMISESTVFSDEGSFVDIASDFPFFIAPDWSVKFVQCLFSGHFPPSIFKISKVSSVYFDKVSVRYSGLISPQRLPAVALDFSAIRTGISISYSNINTAGGISFIDVQEVKLLKSNITYEPSPLKLVSPWLITTSNTPAITLVGCQLDLKGIVGAIKTESSTLVVHSSTIQNARVSAAGAALFTVQSTTLVVYSRISHCTASAGGAIFSHGGVLELRSSNFSFNSAAYEGGAVRGSGRVTIKHSNFFSNSVDTDEGLGGAVFLGEPTMTFIQSDTPTLSGRRTEGINPLVIREDVSSYSGDACPALKEALCSIQQSTFVRNVAARGGALWIAPRTPTAVEYKNDFSFNNATINGGAIGVAESNVVIEDSSFRSNYASPFGAEGTDFPSFPTQPYIPSFLPAEVEWDEHTGVGGAIYLLASQLACIRSSSFLDNAASTTGGAIYVEPKQDFMLLNLDFERNSAKFGGALMISNHRGPLTACFHNRVSLRFKDNGAAYGGAIYLTGKCSQSSLVSSTFESNWATFHGGAIYHVGNTFPSYSQVVYKDNSAGIAGGTIFHIPTSGLLPVDYCNSTQCLVSNDWRKTRYVPRWGPLWASAKWRISSIAIAPSSSVAPFTNISFSETYLGSSRDARSASTALFQDITPGRTTSPVTLYATSYTLRLTFEDLYGQQPTARDLISADVTLKCSSNASRECPFVVRSSSGVNELEISIEVPNLKITAFFPYSEKDIWFNRLSPAPTPMDLDVILKPINGDPSSISSAKLNIQVAQRLCPPGEGLLKSNELSPTECHPCPTNSYNIDGDGYCYRCVSVTQIGPVCEGSRVSYLPGYWAKTPDHLNDLFTDKCALGKCGLGRCEQYHTGLLCDECVSGAYQSLFSVCSPHTCKNPSLALFVLIPLATVVCVAILHIGAFQWPGPIMFFISVAQLSFANILPYLDWAIPQVLPFAANILCGARMTSMQRSFLFAFGPLFAIPVLWTLWIVLRLVAHFIRSNHTARGRLLDWRRAVLTTFSILYVCATPALSGAVSWLQCKPSAFGVYWVPFPSVDCNSEAFRANRILMLIFAFPLWLVPLGASFVFLILRDAKKWPTAYGHTADAIPSLRLVGNQSFGRLVFHFLNGYRSRWWSYIDLLILKILIPVLMSAMRFYGAAEATWVALTCAFATVASTAFHPFLTRAMRITATLALAALASLSALQPDLGKGYVYPFVAFGVTCACLILIVIFFIIGMPLEDTHELETAWDQEEKPLLGTESSNEMEDSSFM